MDVPGNPGTLLVLAVVLWVMMIHNDEEDTEVSDVLEVIVAFSDVENELVELLVEEG